ncbi:MAG: hypothetical protein JNL30_02890 [Rubrivivax sp.]|nr:hypothetical protein [Rubrivivax sp.]
MADPAAEHADDPATDHGAEAVPYIDHDEFRAGLAAGQMRIVVDPERARPFVVQRTRSNTLAVVLIGLGCALALVGQVWPGGALVALGIGARRLVLRQAPKILLHLALSDRAVYAEVTSNGVMEVQRAS